MVKRSRKSVRLKGYDYASAGHYFITICVQDKKCLFGKICSRKMILNKPGVMVDGWWKKLSDKYDQIKIDAYCIMPNHIHGIIIVGAHPCVRLNINLRPDQGQTRGSAPTVAIGTMIQWFKTMSTNEYIRNIKRNDWLSFNKRLWQRNYYEHIIRNDHDLNHIREYIKNNPEKWEEDKYYES